MPVETTPSETYRQDLVDSGVVIKTEGLWKTYEMGAEKVHALRGVDLEMGKAEYVAIMGPSGSGKSTRSEEHTSELQSLRHLVCRLLLEKKKAPNASNLYDAHAKVPKNTDR